MKTLIFIIFLLFPTVAYPATITLNWLDNSVNEDGFKIERRLGSNVNQWQQQAVVPSDVSTVDIQITNFGTRHCFRVRSFNTSGNANPSNTRCVTINVN